MKFINQTFIILFFLIGIMLTLSVGCQFDKIDLVGGPVDTTDTIVIDTTDTTTLSDCDPNVVYFQRDILPIIASSCAKSGCHDVITHEEGIILDNFTHIINTGKIKGGNLNSGDFYKVITETKASKRMPPPPNAALTAEQIAIVKKWIEQGAKELTCNEGSICDDSNVTYSKTVAPILAKSCNGCHNPNFISGGVISSTYSGASAIASSGLLAGTISHAVGFKPMPKAGAKLSSCNIKLINKWISDGAPNN